MKTLNRKKSIGLYSLVVLAAFLLMSSYAYASPDYYNYWTWNTGYSTAYGVDGWVDGGTSKIIFYSGTTAYIYQVTTTAGPDGDNPNLHPLNPDATGAIAPRVFTYDSQFALNSSNYGHDDAFYVGSDGFYLGTAWNGIEKYDFVGNYLSTVVPTQSNIQNDWVQGLAYDEASQSWWTAGGTSRKVWKYDMTNTAAGWTHEFTYTPLAGSDHHDGLEVLSNGNLLFADYAGQIVEYQQDGTFVAQHLHDPFPTELESMGAGALGHYWGGSHSGHIFEFGGGSLPPLVIPVPIDIKPQSCPNPLNVGSKGILPVAICGTEDFDVTMVDPASVRLMGVAPLRSSLEDVATPFDGDLEDCLSCIEEGADGELDLTLKFDMQAIVAALGDVEDGDCLVLTLEGQLLNGTPILGEDVVIILKKGKK